MITETKENETQTGLNNFKPKINLNHNIYLVKLRQHTRNQVKNPSNWIYG